MALDFLFSLPFVFVLSLLIACFLYAAGSWLSPRTKLEKKKTGKLEPYACGENMPARKVQMDIQRFILYVTLFMVFDISAFMFALSFNVGAFFPVLFIIIVASSLLTIIPMIGRKER
jgi:NADH:ubiquinone oxidoreductase subunit 3 (subunit A)